MVSPATKKIKSMPLGATGWLRSRCTSLLATASICVLLTLMIFSPTSAAASSSPKTTSTAPASAINQTTTTATSGQQLHHSSPSSGSSSPVSASANKSADIKPPNKTNGANQQQATLVEPQQQEPTDLSSMYVQIPIAEPVDTRMQDSVQQTLASDQDSTNNEANQADQKASTWTGPWPKKFQIGYIKQSDLHQVLIESLKGDPFTALANSQQTNSAAKSAAGTPSSVAPVAPTKTIGGVKGAGVSSSDSSALIAPQNWPASTVYSQIQRAQQQQQQPSMQLLTKNVYHNSQQQQPMGLPHKFREPKFLQQAMQMNRYQQMNFNQPPSRLFNQQAAQNSLQNAFQQQQQQLMQQQHQYQLAASFPTSFKNQPIYTINNHIHQEQLDANSMQLLLPQQPQLARPQKPADFYGSSWRPVSSDKSEQAPLLASGIKGGSSGQQQQQQPYLSDYQTLNDGFDDGFNSPSRDASSSAGSMNRHPVLSNYLATTNAKLSPAMVVKSNSGDGAGLSSASSSSSSSSSSSMSGSGIKGAGTKSQAADSSSTKSSSSSAAQPSAKGGSDSSMSSPANRRRSQNGNNTGSSTGSTTSTSTTTTSAPNDAQSSTTTTTTAAPGSGADEERSSGSTTGSPMGQSTTSAGASATMSTTSSSVDSETTEPDSEVIDSETTEPSSGDSTTTTMSPMQESTTSSGSMMVAANDGGSLAGDGGDGAEVVTQGSGQQASGTASLPSLAGNERASESGSSTQPSAQKSSAAGSGREETTPTVGSSKGEVEGAEEKKGAVSVASMSDEALLDAVVRTGSEIAKARGAGQAVTMSQLQQPSQQQRSGSSKKARSSERIVQSGSKSGGRKSANKLITKKPVAAAATSSNNKAKQATELASAGSVKGSASRSGSQASSSLRTGKNGSTSSRRPTSAKAAKRPSQKSTRMAGELQRQQQQQQPQLVSMTAAQAQSTAQTLASILLSRCLLSTNCAHLLDVCGTKQAAVPFGQSANEPLDSGSLAALTPSGQLVGTGSQAANSTTIGAAWSVPIGLMSSSIMSLAQALQADKVLGKLAQWREAIENIVDQEAQTGYTLLLPSNEAIERLPAVTMDSWLSNPDLLSQIIDNHIVDSTESIEFGGARTQTRFIRSKGLQVNQHRDKMVTINGKRVVYANQPAPGGRIHVIDGILDWPTGLQANLLDIMDTLKQCDKFDGFVTLAQGTGLTQVLKQDGPLTVFVPSNDALRRIPDDELEVIKNNSTALKEFLMYHVVNGSYFSQDLRDGQQLASILDMKPIQVGVRVDGCSRRLVEANTSPMWRPDIAAKNGVIHILDWYLSTKNNECFNQMSRPAPPSKATPATAASAPVASERLQQLASDSGSNSGYATRVSMPANHKPASPPTQPGEDATQPAVVAAAHKTTQVGNSAVAPQSANSLGVAASLVQGTNSISVSATPLAATDTAA